MYKRQVGAHVIEGGQLLVQSRDLIVLNDHQLLQLVDLFLGVPRLPLVALEHREQTVYALITRRAQISHNLLTHLDFLLVLLELRRDLL